MSQPSSSILSLTELITVRARDQPDDIAFYTGIDEPGNPLRSLTYIQVQKAVDRLCNYYATLGFLPPTVTGELPPQRTIAIFTSTAIDESLLEIALAKLGLSPLLLSVNNSVPAVAHLCKLTKSSHLIYGSKFFGEAKEVQRLLATDGYEIDIVEDKRFPLWSQGGIEESEIEPYPAVLTPEQEVGRIVVVLHSSGSTGFPKPVFITHKGMIANIKGHIPKPGFSALPVYHGFGHFNVFRCYYNAVPFTLFPPHLPLTSANICSIIKASPTPSKQCFAVPYVIKLLGETEEGTRALAAFDVVSYAGAALPDDLGDRLVAAGVNIVSIYGTTETGSFLHSRRDFATDKAWNWLRAEGAILSYLVMEPRGADTLEVVLKDGWPAKIETNRPDGSYATKDLFIRHPQHSDWYKYYGRLDDTLVQLLGEKTNPVPIELAIRGNSPYVAEAIVFGAGRPQVGALILPSELGRELSKDRARFLEEIWPAVEDANAQAPTHSRLLPELVHILEYGTEVPVATKMSILRPACYAKFKDIIDAVYDRFENGTSTTTKRDLSKSELEIFLTGTIKKTLGARAVDLERTSDLFAFGVDSLQATRIRNICQKELELAGRTLGQNAVYENPSVEKLADYILAVRSGDDIARSEEQQHAAMIAMVEKWSAKLELCEPVGGSQSNGYQQESASHVIVLTGATGSLGAHILHQLSSSPSVTTIICLCRATSHANALTRLQDSLRIRKLVLSPDAWAKVQAFAADVNKENLGLTAYEYEWIRAHSTIIIHNAWPVNFVLGVDSFDEHIGGAVNLLSLSLRSAGQFFFSSSVATRQGGNDQMCDEDFPAFPATAVPMGYAMSKWVVEKICQRAAAERGASVGVLRIGQIVGDTQHGVWNETEAWPLMIKGVNSTRTLPQLDERLSWLPVDVAGRAITEIVTQAHPKKAAVYHIVNPSVSNWETVLSGLQHAGLKFDVVDRPVWLDRLAKSDTDGARNPTIKLLAFYRNRFGRATERPALEFRVDLTSKRAPSIASCPAISTELVCKWVQHWRASEFLAVQNG